MAANRFATILYRKVHRMAFLLIYAVLEWILIALLLVSAVFSYLIGAFVSFFGLKPPCIICSRLDHVFDSGNGQTCRDLLCDSHAGEILKHELFSIHSLLPESGDKREDRAAIEPDEIDWKVSLLSKINQSALPENLLCSCCGVAKQNCFYSSYTAALKTEPWDVLASSQKDKSVKEEAEDENDNKFAPWKLEFEKEINSVNTEEIEDQKEQECEKDGDSKGLNILLSCDVANDVSAERLFPIELIDSTTMMSCRPRGHEVVDMMLNRDAEEHGFTAISIGDIIEKEATEVSSGHFEGNHASLTTEIPATSQLHSLAIILTDVLSEDASLEGLNNSHPETATNAKKDFNEQQRYEEESKEIGDANCEISFGSCTCNLEPIEYSQSRESTPEPDFRPYRSSESFDETVDREIVIETEPLRRTARQVRHLAIAPVLNDIVEEGMPETPTTPYSIEGFPVLPKRFLLERRESGTESLDGSIASELENIEPLTLDRLKATLKAERKSLIALYTELEEERSASAIAANQTMAMITRLQEEKAAMQMEALQYQRMMEEQSEYDQEALQLLNEVMMKKEKENRELEKELDLYHEKIFMYEDRERRKNIRRKEKGSRRGAVSCLPSSESDDFSFGSHEGGQSSYSPHESNRNIASTNLLSCYENANALDGCLTEFDQNRLSIVKQFKSLVEKLFKTNDEDEKSEPQTAKHSWVENGNGVDDTSHESVNCSSRDLHVNGKRNCEQRSVGARGKCLLPLFDAIDSESEENHRRNDDLVDGSQSDLFSEFAVGHKNPTIAEEVDHVYRRLQGLEADRDFIKHCILSLKKGDKGMNLLQEILQNLYDLKRVQLLARNSDF